MSNEYTHKTEKQMTYKETFYALKQQQIVEIKTKYFLYTTVTLHIATNMSEQAV